MSDDMPTGLNITSNAQDPKANGNDANILDQLVGAFAELDENQTNAIVQALLPAFLRYDLIAPRIWGDVANLSIPDDVNINDAFFDTSNGKITIEDGCKIGHRCKFIASSADIIIKKGAIIETGATIIGPCVIGEHAIVKAGAVVVSADVPASEAWVGNPAEKVG